MSQSTSNLAAASPQAISGRHPVIDPIPLVLAPTDKDAEHNTIRPAIFPLGCFKLEDITFDFDSSFIVPGIRPAMGDLKALLDEHPKSPLSIFGHADPVGNDEYNKGLSGRRAQSFFALLTRRVDLWEDLHAHESKGWGERAVQIMLGALGFDPGRTDGTVDQPTKDATKDFQRTNGLTDDGVAGTNTRKKLYEVYMDFLCVDQKGAKYQLAKTDFLGRGADPGGKADFQGCSEFNPVLIFSKDEQKAFDDDKDKTARDAENAVNRRVMILLFRPGTKIDVPKWPCPKAKEGTAGCRKRFWSDGEKRRKNTDARREFKDTRDTFACRFYQRMTDNSPCERFGKFDFGLIFAQLFDGDGKDLLPDRKYTIQSTSGLNMKLEGVTDTKGRLRHENVAPGEWELTVEGISEKSVLHVLAPDDTRPQVRCLDNPRLRVVVATPDDEPVEGATVDVSGLGQRKTDFDGVADFGTVRPGDFTFRASKDGFVAPPLTTTVRSGLVGDRVGDGPSANGKVTVKDTKATGNASLATAQGPVRKITATQPGTASLRNDKLVLESSEMASTSSDPDLAKDKNPPFVLIRGSDPVTLVAETSPPGQKVRWSVDPTHGNTEARPTLTTNADGSGTLATDKKGAFSVTASIGTSKILWNVVFVFVDVKPSTTLPFDNPNGSHFVDNKSSASDVKFRSGKFDPADVGQYAFFVVVDVGLDVGPGGDPKWLNDVALFFLQNGLNSTLQAEYSDGTVIKEVLKDPVNKKFPVVDSNGTTPDYFGPLCPSEPPFTLSVLQVKTVRDDGNLRVISFGDSPDGAFSARSLKGFVQRIRGVNDFKLGVASITLSSKNCVVVHAELTWTADFDGKVDGADDGKTTYVRDNASSKLTGPDRKFQLISPATGGQNARAAKFELFAPKFTDAVTRR